MTSRIAAIVDPYASGSDLAREFVLRGYECVAVQSTAAIPEVFEPSFRPEDFALVLQHQGDVARTAAELERRGVGVVLAGCELGVELADELSERLGLVSNGARGSRARRDKYLMAQRVSEAGLRTPAQHCSSDPGELLAWVRGLARWPVIVKPLQSSSSDHVARCGSEAEVLQAFDAIARSVDVLGHANDAVLVQEFLAGTEYIVDTVSCQGRHRIAAFWRYGVPETTSEFVCYDSMELLPCEGELQRRLFEYTRGVLDALEIQNGPAHCELMWVDGAPLLVEIGARLSAGNNCTINRLCSGVCQLDLTLDAYVDPERFLADVDRPYALTRTAMNVFLMPGVSGVVRRAPRLDEIERLASLHELHVGLEPGEEVSRVVGVVTLLHEDPEVVQADLLRIRHLERSGLYDIEPAR